MVASINVSSEGFSNRKFSRIISNKLSSNYDNMVAKYNIYLNKSFSKNVVDYAHTLCNTILDLKQSSKELSYFVDEYKTVEDKIETLDATKKEKVNSIFKEKIERFVYDYDLAFNFANKQQHSQSLTNFSSELFKITTEYGQMLKNLYIIEDKNNHLLKSFDLSNTADKQNINKKLDNIKAFVNEIYNSTQNILSKPMSEHMNFKDLHYYYNYKLDIYENNTFRLIETGMIIDVAL